MYLRVNYQWCCDEATTDIMLYSAAFLPENHHREALALDGLRVIFQTLEESTLRLDEKLLEIKTKQFPKGDDQSVSLVGQVHYTSIMSEVWIVVDNIRRIPLFLKFIPGVPNAVAGPDFASVVDEVKDLRDSLHHIDQRVKTYFFDKGESILGDILWRYRQAPHLPEEVNLLCSGISRMPKDKYDLGNVEDARFLGRVGNYDLRIDYVRRPYYAMLKTYGDEERVEVNLENAISVVNRIIVFINKKYSKYFNSIRTEEITSDTRFPMVLSVRERR